MDDFTGVSEVFKDFISEYFTLIVEDFTGVSEVLLRIS